MNQHLIDYSLEQSDEVVEAIIRLLNSHKVVTFTGLLGAGKTTLIKHILKKCGVHDLVTSPTFAYLNIYNSVDGRTFYHFDLYRIKNASQFFEAGFGDYLGQSNAVVLIEWPEIIASFLNESVFHIFLEYKTATTRTIKIVTQ